MYNHVSKLLSDLFAYYKIKVSVAIHNQGLISCMSRLQSWEIYFAPKCPPTLTFYFQICSPVLTT
jgi:hypothetical protein